MVNWQVTATTIHCPAVGEEVTIMVYKDWSTRCTGYERHSRSGVKEQTNSKNRQAGKKAGCEGPDCPLVTQYRDKLKAEEQAG